MAHCPAELKLCCWQWMQGITGCGSLFRCVFANQPLIDTYVQLHFMETKNKTL